MRYAFGQQLHKLSGTDGANKNELLIEVINTEDFRARFSEKPYLTRIANRLEHVQYCKAELLSDCVIGTVWMPDKNDLTKDEAGFGYYIDQEQMIFVDNNNLVAPILERMMATMQPVAASVHFFFTFLDYLIENDMIFLQEYEADLEDLEDQLQDSKTADIHTQLLHHRREISRLTAYYRQLRDMSEQLADNRNEFFSEQNCRLFSTYSSRIAHLYEHTQMLKEFCMQLSEMQQSQMDIRQNQVMQFLTVVTTIFMPLTLITGWYGMNFAHMPELEWTYGYITVLVISAIILVAELWYFKRKKWF